MWLENEPKDVNQCVIWRTISNEISVDGWENLDCKYEQQTVCQQPSER
jgi:hypothetical protein